MAKQQIGIGMLGSGWMGKTHTNAFKTIQYMHWNKANYEPVLEVIGQATEQRGMESKQQLGFNSYSVGWSEIINNPEVTVFDNVAPDGLHVQPCIDAANANKHVICEKPLAVTSSDAKKMLDAVNKSGVKHMCCFSYRFFPATRLAYELIQQGAVGKVYHFAGKYYQDQGSREDTPTEDVWYINWSGIGHGITSHLIDMSRFLVGDISSVSGLISTYNKVRPSKNGMVNVTADEGFHSLFEFENGATGVIESLGVGHGKRSEFSWQIYGSKGSLMWDVSNPNHLQVFLADGPNKKVRGFTNVLVTEPNHPFMDVWWPAGHVLGWEHGHINMLAHFLDCIANDKDVAPFAGTFKDGYIVTSIIESINRSALERRWVDLTYKSEDKIQ
jgi:predicted dehydrogenase